MSDDTLNCGPGGGADTLEGLRIASVFIVLTSSTIGAFFPVITRRSRLRNVVPDSVFQFAKYFGSGVIIATAFIHLLDPAISELGSPCLLALSATWANYPWALALCMISVFGIFFVELFAFRWGSARLAKLGIGYDNHAHEFGDGAHATHGPEPDVKSSAKSSNSDSEQALDKEGALTAHERAVLNRNDNALAQIVGVFILEFGVLLHSVLIGLTLAVDPNFKVLFVVIIFHQMFEGLGLGARLSYLELPIRYNYVAYVGAALYGLTTPIGIAVGLGVRTTYNPDSTTASIVSGVLDSLSAGVLLYTGLVELLAHEFLFSQNMRHAPIRKVMYACLSMLAGAGLMALLGRWA